MNKAMAMEEMYLIYQASRKHLAGLDDSSTDCAWEELEAAFRSFCEREPLGGMFLESVLEELINRAEEKGIEVGKKT